MFGEMVLPKSEHYPQKSFVGKAEILDKKVTAKEVARLLCIENDEISLDLITKDHYPNHQTGK